ncbi:class I SAM-dependent methyltransferase [Frankia sp. AiPs1]|uniref:class I SAM-dependent methyltransferase n=1 Tax=Frankia sp. AiPs1 TaxID=573493 RepID=UPI002042ECAA|nr:class I SAM-dependent methyltransferase [Frankia sp. AiPs1]MCM3924682.1 class I SAM-dependent methyltransferase [Frankia sp. AiPs1]
MLRRAAKFEVTLNPTAPSLLAPMSAEPRQFLLDRALDEFVADLGALDEAAEAMVPGAARPRIDTAIDAAEPAVVDGTLLVSGQEVMQTWEAPLMRALARAVTTPGGAVLEIGFGLGLSAGFVQELGPARHVIVEANPQTAAVAEQWARTGGRRGVEIVTGRWQDTLAGLGRFDGVLFDTYPMDETEVDEYVMRDATFAEHFFAPAAAALTEGGAFTYYSNEIDSVSRRHQRALLRHFRTFAVEIVDGLRPPEDCSYWWAPSMAVIVARRPRRS